VPREGLIPLQDEQVVGMQLTGDQPGGLLRGVQRVQGQHHPGHVQRGEQVGGDRALAAFVGDLPLTQHDPTVVGDRRDQEHPPGGSDGPVQEFAVDRSGWQHPGWRRMRHRAERGAALFAFDRSRGLGDHRSRCPTPRHVRGVPAQGRIEGVTVEVGQHPAEGAFTGDRVPGAPGVEAGPQPRQDLLRGPGRPLPDRGDRVVADHQSRAGAQHEDHHQRMPATPHTARIRYLPQPLHQRAGHRPRIGVATVRGQLDFPQGKVSQVVNGRANQRR
jgi:hypothetical protein